MCFSAIILSLQQQNWHLEMCTPANTGSYVNHNNGNALSVTNKKDFPFCSKTGDLSQQLLKIMVYAPHSASERVYPLLVATTAFLELWQLCS